MKEIQLTKGYVAIVDDSDYDELVQWKWYALVCKRGIVYALRAIYGGCKNSSKSVLMHRQILGVTDSNITVDHKDGNTLDNRRSNLRLCSKAQNNKNKSAHRNSNSKYVGVYFCKRRNGWMARITENRKTVFSKQFKTEIEAAVAYNNKATELRGEFAKLNKVSQHEYDFAINNKPKPLRFRRVIKINTETGSSICEYESVASAARDNGVVPSRIYACCKGESKTSAGFKWEFKDNK